MRKSRRNQVCQHALRVLVVEDEAETGQSVRDYLEYRGHTVDLALTGKDALDLARRAAPNVLVCDWKLADGEDGIEVAERIQSAANVPVILVTGHRLQQAREKARSSEVEISAFRRKPVSLSDLAEVIEGAGQPP